MSTELTFEAIRLWESRANTLIDAKEAYRVAHAKAYVASTEKTDSSRKASADAATSELRVLRDRAEVAERAAYHHMIALRGSAGEVEAAQ